MKRAYVGNIPFDTTEEDLRVWFAPYELVEINIVHDRSTGRPKGFAFVEFASQMALDDAIAIFNGRDLGGRKILVNDATERKGNHGQKKS